MTAYRGTAPSPIRGDVVEQMVANRGDIESAHAVFLYDAALQTGDGEIVQRVGAGFSPPSGLKAAATHFQPYRLARDYGAYLKSFAVAKRLGDNRIIDAAKYNLAHAESFEDFSFA